MTHLNCATSTSSARVRNFRAFTLIELLIVIAIIAILAAMLLPVLSRAKLKGTQTVCLSNQKELALAFVIYGNDNGDKILPMSPYNAATPLYEVAGGFWNASIPNADNVTMTLMAKNNLLTYATVGQQVNNSAVPGCPLASIISNPGVYECPGDTRLTLSSKSVGWSYGSYSKSQNFGGEYYNNFWGLGSTYETFGAIRAASDTMMTIEDAGSGTSGYNNGTWVLSWNGTPPTYFSWTDPVPMFHGVVSTFGFADGHAQFHKWFTPAIIKAGQADSMGIGANNPPTMPATALPIDQNFMHNIFRFPDWK
jgi:prepilin-type N-terminal cleavage/methylation domain-containing protein